MQILAQCLGRVHVLCHPTISLVLYTSLMTKPQPSVVVVGGGTGTFVALSGLKEYPVELSAVVTMMDSGGSTGRPL